MSQDGCNAKKNNIGKPTRLSRYNEAVKKHQRTVHRSLKGKKSSIRQPYVTKYGQVTSGFQLNDLPGGHHKRYGFSCSRERIDSNENLLRS